MTTRFTIVLAAFACSGNISCFDTNTEVCANGLRCAVGYDCQASISEDTLTEQWRCVASGCGDGEVGIGEVCDDGNTMSGDGCSEDCESDETCGNGIIDEITNEVCDDGNNENGDGCSASCLLRGSITSSSCYVVSDVNDLAGDDFLLVVDTANSDPMSNAIVVGNLGAEAVEAIAYDASNGILYGADADELGLLDLETGELQELESEFGTGDGALGSITFDDVDGLAFDPTDQRLYGSVRRQGNPNPTDLLIIIDTATGAHVSDAFGTGIDYVEIPEVAGNLDIDDLAFDSAGQLYGLATGTTNDHLIQIDKATGQSTDIGSTIINDIEGMDFDSAGTLRGSSGVAPEHYTIETSTGLASFAAPLQIDLFTDFEAMACL